MSIPARIAAVLVPALSLFLVVGCPSSTRRTVAKLPAAAAPARLELDPAASPVKFRWLADDAVLVSSDVGQRGLAGFGNYVERAALKVARARLSVWDDEAAWKRSGPEGTQSSAHQRAVYVKDPSPDDPVDRFLVFDREGKVVYERDFRSYPLTESD